MKVVAPICIIVVVCQFLLMYTVGCSQATSIAPPEVIPYFTAKTSESSKGIYLEIRCDGLHRRNVSSGSFIVLDKEPDLENYENDLLLILEKVREVRQKLNYVQSRALEVDASRFPTDTAPSPQSEP